jgi:hypothetical protein
LITIGQRWMAKVKSWVEGEKHPDTPLQIYKNLYNQDRVRRILPARCRTCGYVVQQSQLAVREILFTCDDKNCTCHIQMGSRSHQVCNLCYDMHHALYTNHGLKNMNYFREMDDKAKKDYDDFKRRERQ